MTLSLLSRLVSRLWQKRLVQFKKEISPAFKSVERRYYRMDDGSRKYIEFLRLTSIGYVNDNLDSMLNYACAAVDALDNATADADEVKDISYKY